MIFRCCANFFSTNFASRRLFFVLQTFLMFSSASLSQAAQPVSMAKRPDRKTIEKYIDQEVKVFGHYAAVRLPIKNGVTIWNPTTIAHGPGGIIFVANYTGE